MTSSSNATDDHQHLQKPVRPKRKYTSQACIECQRRKRKCSGGGFCDNCRSSGLECSYAQSRSSRRRELTQRAHRLSDRNTAPVAPSDVLVNLGVDLPESTWTSLSPRSEVRQMAMLRNLQHDFEALGNQVAQLRTAVSVQPSHQDDITSINTTIIDPMCSDATMGDHLPTIAQRPVPALFEPGPPQVAPMTVAATADYNGTETVNTSSPEKSKVTSGTSFFQQLDLLDRSVNGKQTLPDQPSSQSVDDTDSGEKDPELLLSDLWQEANRIVERTRCDDLDTMYHHVDIFFEHIHPHWPFINEAQFRTHFAAFWAKDTDHLNAATMLQFAALLNFVVAASQALYHAGEKSNDVPGWKQYFRGEKLFTYISWLQKSSITTLQILLVKTLYCFFAGHLDAAHVAVGPAVRLCFQMSLHDELSWGPNCTFYHRTYRQRVFWSLFCLSSIVSQHAGVPDLMHQSNFEVEYPKCVDDRMLYPRCLPLQELPQASFVPYLIEVIKWAKLSTQVWELVSAAKTKEPMDPDAINRIDDKVQALSTETPSFLKWATITTNLEHAHIPSFRWQQALILYLRERSLRILLRRNDMVSGRFDTRAAQTCIDVAVEVITAVELSRDSSFAKRTAGYTLVLHLTQTAVPMICIIVRNDIDETLAKPAIDAFTRALRIIKEYAPAHSFARRTLRHLDRPIRTATETIKSRWPQYADGCGLTPLSSQMGAPTINESPSDLLLSQPQCWDHSAQSGFPKPGGSMTMEMAMLDDVSMPWDDSFGIQDPFGIWHTGHLVL